jgi:uncharacterized phage-like protein YoqJ
MADQPTGAEGFTFSPNTITAQDYQTVVTEREEAAKKQLAASNEFMYQHYARLLKALDISYERATKANITLEKKQRREEAKQKREALKTATTPKKP